MNLDSKIRYSVSEYSGVDVPKKFEMSLSARTFESCHDADDNGTDDEYSDDDESDSDDDANLIQAPSIKRMHRTIKRMHRTGYSVLRFQSGVRWGL